MDKTIDLVYMIQSLALTVLFVGLIGYERQRKHKIAGMTTHVLVAIGACALAIVQEVMMIEAIEYANNYPLSSANVVIERQRIIAQVIAGVGFLGTGAIIKRNGNISGLTTASTLWISAIIGLIFGLGMYTLGIIVSVSAMLALVVIKGMFKSSHFNTGEEDDNE